MCFCPPCSAPLKLSQLVYASLQLCFLRHASPHARTHPPMAPVCVQDAFAVKDDLAASAKLAASAADLVKQLPQAQDVCDCMAALLAGDLDGTSLGGAEAVLLPLFAPGGCCA